MALAEARPVSLARADGVGRHSFARIAEVVPIPNLIKVQRDSFDWFLNIGLQELFAEISPIQDFTSQNMELELAVAGPNGESGYSFGAPKLSEDECREHDLTFAAPLKVRMRLKIKSGENAREIKEQDIFMGDFPLMTDNGTFIINGAERVVVSQLVRSPGVYFTVEEDPTSGRELCMGKLIPSRGTWLEFETSSRDVMSVKVDRKRKIPVTTLLRALPRVVPEFTAISKGTDEKILALFEGVDEGSDHRFVQSTLDKDPASNAEEALLEFYRRLRPGDPPNADNARSLLSRLFFNFRRYDLGKVGRYKVNQRLGLQTDTTMRILTPEDLVEIVREMVRINHGQGTADDIDHLGNRRVRAVGEQIQNQFRVGLLRMERVVKERMSITDPATATPSSLTNVRPVVAAIREFFGASQLSQFMDQTNPLAELACKRRLNALGPGGLSRDRAGFEVRDVHYSHYGRICPIETPEGSNIGLIGSLATYGRINEYGFIETPYRRVVRQVENRPDQLVGQTLRSDLKNKDGKVVASAGTLVDEKVAEQIGKLGQKWIDVKPHVIDEIRHLTADEEDRYIIAQANVHVNEDGTLTDELVSARHGQRFLSVRAEQVDYMDVSPKQTMSVAGALIPFLEHDDANRALMGSNMQRQAVPLLKPSAPLVGTGMEERTARDSGQVVLSLVDGVVESVTGEQILVRDDSGNLQVCRMAKFISTNQGTCLTQRPIVVRGQRVRRDQPLADSSSTDAGELALGQNVLVAFMSWEGGNFEDAILLSERLVRDDTFTSIHIEKHEVEARDTKLGPEEITRDIPNVGEDSLKDLDENGIIRVGAEVKAGDILVGKITPKGETELTAEERLLRAIFGEKAREVKDTSLRVPHGERGKVVNVQVFERDSDAELPAGVNKMVRVSIAQKRKISAGDKMAGRHGNKGVVSRILPLEDMPFLPDGRPVDIILNPLGVPSRMNVGQILETHLGWAADQLGVKFATPVFDGATEADIRTQLRRAGLPESGKIRLRDGAPVSTSTRRSRSATSTCSSWCTWSRTRFTRGPLGRTRLLPNSRSVVRRSSAASASVRWRCGLWRRMARPTRCRRS